MSRRSRGLFLLLVIAQVAHSVEEFVTRLYEVFAPVRFLSGLLSDDLAVGFAIINVTIIAVGFCCYLGPVRSGLAAARVVAWLWVVVELVNGIGHIVFAALARGYFPGVLTAVALVCLAASLARSLLKDSNRRVHVASQRVA